MTHKTLLYKGYLGSIEISLDDNCLFGKILHVRDLITYEAETPDKLRIAFENAVDNYLEHCAELGLSPDKPLSGTFNVRLSPELHRQCSSIAAVKGVSLNEFVYQTLEAATTDFRTVVREVYTTHVQRVEISSHEGLFDEAPHAWQLSENQTPKH